MIKIIRLFFSIPLILLAIYASCFAQSTPPGWTRLDDCWLATSDYADGDSFHVTQTGGSFHFRLYFVDCPETDSRFPDRVYEQMRAFGLVNVESVMSAGRQAHEFTVRALSSPFTVLTKWEDARGDSHQERFYAIVIYQKKNLAEELVRAGLARAFGMFANYPSEQGGHRFFAKLKNLQNQAAREHLGAFAGSSSTPGVCEPLVDQQGRVTDDILKGSARTLEIEIERP